MEAQVYECVDDKLGVPDTLLKGVRENEYVINVNDDADSSQVEEHSEFLTQSVKCERCILHTETQDFELVDLAIPHKAEIS